MTAATLNVATFILARLAEEEDRVDEIPDWHCTDSARGEGWGTRGSCPLCDAYMFDGTESATGDAFWEHIERVHQRTRVLAYAARMREIVALHSPEEHSVYGTEGEHGDCQTCDYEDGYMGRQGEDWPCPTMRQLAAVYADHPDYREEWKP